MRESKISDHSRRTRGNRRRWLLSGMLVIVVAILIWIAYFWFSLPAPVLISPETTWITEPLTADGTFVDFSQAINDAFPASRGTWEQSPWFLLTHNDVPGRKTDFYRDPVNIIKKEHLKATYEYLGLRSYTPFSETDDPELAAIIDSNEKWYNIALPTEPGPPLLPSSDEGFYLLFVNGGPHGPMIRRFALRTMLAFGSGDAEKGQQGLVFQAEVCRHGRGVPGMLGSHHADTLETELCQQIWSVAVTQPQVDKMRVLDIIAMLPAPETLIDEMVERFDRFERIVALDEIQKLQRGHQNLLSYRFFPREEENHVIQSIRWGNVWRRIDYNALMKQQNSTIETLKTILRSGPFEEQNRKLEALSKSVDYSQSSLDPSDSFFAVTGDPTSEITQLMLTSNVGLGWKASGQIHAAINRYRVCHLAIRLAAFMQEHGHYPDSLSHDFKFASLPTPPTDMTIDAFTGRPFRYTSDGVSLRIHCFGPNGIDNETTPTQPEWPRYSDDFIWVVPP